jgi:hypothetical protein
MFMLKRITKIQTLAQLKNLGYTKENCYWASRQEQALNRRLFLKNKSGIKGIEYRSYGAFRIRARRNKSIVLENYSQTLLSSNKTRALFENIFFKWKSFGGIDFKVITSLHRLKNEVFQAECDLLKSFFKDNLFKIEGDGNRFNTT